MGIAKIGTKSLQLWRAVSCSAKNGTKYLYKEAKSIFANNTKVGKRLKEGINDARESIKIKMSTADNTENLITKTENRLKTNSLSAYKNLKEDKEFINIYNKLCLKREPLGETIDFSKMSEEEIIQTCIEYCGIGPTKASQIFSNNIKLMEKIQAKYPQIAQAMKNTKSKCLLSRTVEQAQNIINKSFPDAGYVIEKKLGVASIGETYLVRKPDGTSAVVKMIKQGVDGEQLQLEEKILKRLIKEFYDKPEDVEKISSNIKNLYKDWAKELDFTQEVANNKLLAKGAKRYRVADITNISKDGKCIIMNKANGVQMDKLLNMLRDYKANPKNFLQKYKEAIAENPWLAEPDKVAKQLPQMLLRTFDEQFMFLKKGGKTIMHGDPHTGNFFITQNAKGKLIPEFIDTGNCVTRTAQQIKEDISFFSNYFVGNSRGVAEYLIKQCKRVNPKSKPKSKKNIQDMLNNAEEELLTCKIAKDIQEAIFGKKQNIKDFSNVQSVFNSILEKHGLQMSADNATAIKAQMQFFSVISESGKLSGQTLDILTLMKDIPNASLQMVKHGKNPYYAIKDALNFAYYNQKQATGTAYQFLLKDTDKILKSNGELLAVA